MQEEGVKQIQNSHNKHDMINIIVAIPVPKHFCYQRVKEDDGFVPKLCTND